MKNECLEKLINDHWAYVEEMLQAHTEPDEVIEIVEFHYKSAFKHGFKHASENGDCLQDRVIDLGETDMNYPDLDLDMLSYLSKSTGKNK